MSFRKRKLLRLLVTAVLLLTLTAGIFPASAFAVSQDELDQLKSERDALVKQRQQQQAVVNDLKNKQAGILYVKQALDDRNMYTLQQIQLIDEEIALYDDMIADKSIEVDDAKALEKEQLERYRSRVRAMEENGNISFIAVLLNSSDLGELLTAADDIGEIMESDRELEDAYIEARENTEQVKAEYEEYKAGVVEKKDELRAEQEELELELKEADRLIAEVTEDLENNASVLEEFAAAEKEAETNVANMVLAIEKKRQEEAAASGGGYGGGGGTVVGTGAFSWPVPTCTYITSRFGPRIHPITGRRRNHSGIDIGAASGDTVIAADGGTVTMAGVNGGYGNCVMINHGNGYQTLYGHMSSIAVSSGQEISKGQTVGYVGSTGVSTGPHLHFEVWKDGSRIDPEQFFSGLTFSPSCGV
ncbi:MAG: murein hydrolase activator EnvC family protein [Candidatus Limivicinus sp.]|jgi:murein DD-endopeptidase MepM/ murein hydrolase activator NlpD